MLKDILAVSGKQGLFRLVSKGTNMMIIESLIDKKRVPAYTRDKVISLADVLIYTDSGDVLIGEVFNAIKEKEGGETISKDMSKASTEELRAYLAEVLPNFDRERVYPTDIKKMLKWYDILITCGITDFSKKEPEEADVEEAKEDNETSEEDKEAQKASAAPLVTTPAATTAKPATVKPKGISMTSVKSAKTPHSKPIYVIPKKSIVGSKRGG